MFSSMLLGGSCWRFQVSLGGECGQGVEAEQLIVTDSFSFRSPEISILGLGGESGVLNQTFYTKEYSILVSTSDLHLQM